MIVLFKYLCMYAKMLQLCLTLCDPMEVAHQVPPTMRLSRQEYWNVLPCPPPTQESNPQSLISPSLADKFFTTSIIWEAQPQGWD